MSARPPVTSRPKSRITFSAQARIMLMTVLAVGGCRAPAADGSEGAIDRISVAETEAAVTSITAEDVAHRVATMAHDSMKGRDTPGEGLEQTAAWIASELRRLGLRGGGEDGGFMQRYPLTATLVDRERSTFIVDSDTLPFGDDVLPATTSLVEDQRTGELVVVSGLNPLSGSARTRLRGNHVLLLAPTGSRGEREVRRAIADLVDAGALTVSIMGAVREADWAATATAIHTPAYTRAWGRQSSASVDPDIRLYVRRAAMERLLVDRDLDFEALAEGTGSGSALTETGVRLTVTTRMRQDSTTAPNVIGVLEGRDPELRDEYVVFSAHMDHVGVGAPDESGDSIFNGADDDASGTAAVIEVAEAMASLPSGLRRSMIFLLVSGEEKGLWGSEWYTEHPAVPIDAHVANLNADMVGRNWPDTIVAIGKEHSDLGATLERVNAGHPELGMTAIDDLWPEERFYFRSDHFNFARNGVPVLFFFNGTHPDYHGRDDEPDRIDSEKAARIAKLMFHLGVEIGERQEAPVWNPESYERIVTQSR